MGTSTGSGGTGGADRIRREYESSSETKPGFRTSEFLSSMIASVGVLIAAAVADEFSAEEAWRLVSFLSIGYMISRGLAKIGVSRNAGNHSH